MGRPGKCALEVEGRGGSTRGKEMPISPFSLFLFPILLKLKLSHRAASTQHVVRNSLWVLDVEKRDSNFRVSKSTSVTPKRSRGANTERFGAFAALSKGHKNAKSP